MLKQHEHRIDRFVWIVLAAALLLRVAVILVAFDGSRLYTGDGPFYVSVAQEPSRLGFPELVPLPGEPGYDPIEYGKRLYAVTSIGPAYPAFLIPFFNLIPDSLPALQVTSARLAQAALDVAIALFVYLIAFHIFGRRVARVALVVQALDPRFIFTSGGIATETLFIMLFAAFLVLYLHAHRTRNIKAYGRAGAVLGLAVLTRPVPLLFPALLAVHAGLRREGRRAALQGVGVLTGVMLVFIAPWTIRTAIIAGEVTPVSNTPFVHAWRASRPDGDAISTDEAVFQAAAEDIGYRGAYSDNAHVENSEYISAALKNILEEPLGWAARTVDDTVDSYLQPYGTVILTPRGAGVKQTAAAFLEGNATLVDVLAVPGFWRRALMYAWHTWGLLGGLAGLLLALKRRQHDAGLLALWIVYVTALTAPLLVEPRYLFPTMIAYTILGASGTVQAWRWLASRAPAPRRLGTSSARLGQEG